MFLVVDWLWLKRGSEWSFYLFEVGLANGIKPYVTRLEAQYFQHNVGGQVVNTNTSQCMMRNYPQSLIYRKSDICKRKFLSLKLEKWRQPKSN